VSRNLPRDRQATQEDTMDFAEQFRVRPGTKVRLADHDPGFTKPYASKKDARKHTAQHVAELEKLQYLLYAESKRSLLIVLQAMDAGGKDGTIRHVMGPINPQGCQVTSFKVPTPEELAHDFLWRIHKAVPRHGQIGIFNRSHYEDVLVVRVHNLVPKGVWSKRYAQINAFEKCLADSRVHVLKFFLNISKDEQLARFRDRLRDPDRQWKASPADFAERKLWDDYQQAYEAALSRCSTAAAPWFIIPANHKWFRNLAVSAILVQTLRRLDMKFPKPAFDISKIVVE